MRGMGGIGLRKQMYIFAGAAIFLVIFVQVLYYYRFTALTKERANAFFAKMTKQIGLQLETLSRNVQQAANKTCYSENVLNYIIETDYARQFELKGYVEDYINYVISFSDNIDSMQIVRPDGENIIMNPAKRLHIMNSITKEYIMGRKPLKDSLYTHVYYDGESGEGYYAYIEPVFSAYRSYPGYNYAAVAVILCKTNYFQKYMNDLYLSQRGIYFMLDEKDNLIASNSDSPVGQQPDTVIKAAIQRSKELRNGEIRVAGRKYLIHISPMINLGWKMVVLVPDEELTSDMIPLRKIGVAIGGLTVLVFMLYGYLQKRNFTDPISRLIGELRRVGEKNLEDRLKVQGSNEIGMIAENINQMMDKIDRITHENFKTQDALYNAELQKKHAELNSLQSQINPHFLYNTLECMRSIACYYKVKELADISQSMAKIFRYCIKEMDVVTIRDEMGCIQEYFSIMNIRYRNRFEIQTDIKEEVLGKKIIKMVLQPIVENAVYHGLENVSRRGVLKVRGYFNSNQDIALEFCDNGKGIDDKELERLCERITNYESIPESYSKRSIGLLNINKRIKFTYGNAYGISVASNLNVGTTVQLVIPANE